MGNRVGGDYELVTIDGVDCLAEGFPNLCPTGNIWRESGELSLFGDNGEMHATFTYTFFRDTNADGLPDQRIFRKWEGTYTATAGDPDISVVLSLARVDVVTGASGDLPATVVDIPGWTSTDPSGRLRGGTTITFLWAGRVWVMVKQD